MTCVLIGIVYRNLKRALAYGQKYKVIDAFDKLFVKFDTQRACEIIFGDKSDYIKYKILKMYNPNTNLLKLKEARMDLEEKMKY